MSGVTFRQFAISVVDLAVDLEGRLHRPFGQQFVSDIEGRQEIEDEELLRQIAWIQKDQYSNSMVVTHFNLWIPCYP